MQKVKTKDYEFLARLLTDRHLYLFKWDNRYVLTIYENLEIVWKGFYFNRSIKYLLKTTYNKDFVYASTLRGVWKKMCKELQKSL